MALFVDDLEPKPKPATLRTVVFSIRDDGKIDPDGIYLNGFEGQLTGEKFFDIDWSLRRTASQKSD